MMRQERLGRRGGTWCVLAIGLAALASGAAAQELSQAGKLVTTHRVEPPQGSVPGGQAEIDVAVRGALADHVAAMMEGLSAEAREGYRHLTRTVYLPPDFSDAVVDDLTEQSWTLPYQTAEFPDVSASGGWSAEKAAALRAFGISPRPGEPSEPLQYVRDGDQWVMNCFACHGGSTYGVPFPGAPNTTYALESLTEQVRRVKLRKKIPLTHMDVGSMFMPLGTTVGTSNAVMFGVALMNYRDADLNVFPARPPAMMTHHDMDTPPWWHFSKKTHMYIDAFADKGHKGLMQFMLVRQNGPEKFHRWAADFADVYRFLSEVKPPPYPLSVDAAAAERGSEVFAANCASCHGSYGPGAESYPELNVALADVGTDPVRHEALTPQHRKHYGESWFADYGRQDTVHAPAGYTAPPLDGVWASAPYFHNGSVPTLRDVLYPDERPTVWRRQNESFDAGRVGWFVDRLDDLPPDYRKLSNYERRWYFDTRVPGKSHRGHDYPAALSDSERSDLLEYLKTL